LDSKEMYNRMAGYVAIFNKNDRDRNSHLINNDRVLEWMSENIPMVDLPDKIIERAYYFRWWSYRKHIRKSPDGYVITEFMPDVAWAGKHNTINCAAGHHFYEGRWIKESKYLDEYLSFWFEGSGSVRSYSFWVADAAYKRYLVTGDIAPIKRHFSDFISNYEAWELERGDDNGLFWQVDDREGMELSMGGTGQRPNINSYMYADAKAISAMALLLGDNEKAAQFEEKARRIGALMRDILWDDEKGFFKTFVTEKHRKIQHEKYHWADGAYTEQPLGLCPVPELFGYAPWYYGVMDKDAEDYLRAWRFITDPGYFTGPYGLATAPVSHPDFMRPHRHECAWDGPSWPFATCQALGAMARTLRNYPQLDMAGDFMRLVIQYAAAHRLEEIDWIDENYDPLTGEWIARKRLYERNDSNKDRGQYYNHSTFCDLVISDVIGLQFDKNGRVSVHPLAKDWPYFCLQGIYAHGRELCVMYDKDGSRYGMGAGLTVTVN